MLIDQDDVKKLTDAAVKSAFDHIGVSVPDLVKACPRAYVIGRAAVIHGIWAVAAIAITFILVKLGWRG